MRFKKSNKIANAI